MKSLCIYYGWPSVKGASFFRSYDLIVFGDGLEFDSHADHTSAYNIAETIALNDINKQIFGYVCLGNSQSLSLNEIDNRIDLWSKMASGIFIDEAGFDFWTNPNEMRIRQNQALLSAHKRGMNVMMNSWRPQDIIDADWKPGDYWLAESFDDPSTISRLKLISDARRKGLKIAGVQMGESGLLPPKQGVVDAWGTSTDLNYGA